MKQVSLRIILILFAFFSFSTVSAQSSREHIRNAISQWGGCKNVAITLTNGDLALYGRNAYASKGCPFDLVQALHELNNDNETIEDVCLTENGE